MSFRTDYKRYIVREFMSSATLAGFLLALTLLAACTSYGPREWKPDFESTEILTAEEIAKIPLPRKFLLEQSRWEKRAAEPTPSAWGTGKIWDFDLYRGRSQWETRLTFEITDEPTDPCLGGTWKKLRLLGGPERMAPSPAYSVEGRNLQILLSTGLCDAYSTLNGVLDDDRFLGKHEHSGMWTHTLHGRVTGRARVQ